MSVTGPGPDLCLKQDVDLFCVCNRTWTGSVSVMGPGPDLGL